MIEECKPTSSSVITDKRQLVLKRIRHNKPTLKRRTNCWCML